MAVENRQIQDIHTLPTACVRTNEDNDTSVWTYLDATLTSEFGVRINERV